MKNWTDFPREDLNMIPTMIEAGWAPEFSDQDTMHKRTQPDSVPHDAVSFVKGIVHVWRASKDRKRMHWRVAELVEGRYTNHRWVDSLEELLKENI